MKTSATNRRIRILVTAIRDETLIPRPEFQRRLVWANRHKVNFIDTVLKGYPFPEIYIAAGDVDPDTGEGTEMLVDGQQRLTTLYQYFTGSPELRLPDEIPSYKDLSDADKRAYLEYEVVIRDLGQKSIEGGICFVPPTTTSCGPLLVARPATLRGVPLWAVGAPRRT